jgi:hypothetical protein
MLTSLSRAPLFVFGRAWKHANGGSLAVGGEGNRCEMAQSPCMPADGKLGGRAEIKWCRLKGGSCCPPSTKAHKLRWHPCRFSDASPTSATTSSAVFNPRADSPPLAPHTQDVVASAQVYSHPGSIRALRVLKNPRFNQQALIDTTPLPDDIPKVKELGASSAPLLSASFFIGARCKAYNDDYMMCKTEANGRGELECMKEGRKVTRCAASVYVLAEGAMAESKC